HGSAQVECRDACFVCFFFSSRRRHTRSLRDWSSDVCSSDLAGEELFHALKRRGHLDVRWVPAREQVAEALIGTARHGDLVLTLRSEERRVGKECRQPNAALHATIKAINTAQ